MFLLKSVKAVIVLSVSLGLAGAVVAAESQPDKVKDKIAQKAKAAKLDETKSAVAEKDGKKVKFVATPQEVPDTELTRDGAIIGKLTTDLPKEELGLEPGDYHLYLVKESETWKLYAVAADGTVSEPATVRVEKATRKYEKPEISFEEDEKRPAISLAGSISIRLFGKEIFGVKWE